MVFHGPMMAPHFPSLCARKFWGSPGPEGAGKSELLRTVFGLMPQTKGRVTYDGQVLGGRTPREMLRRGAAFVPEDRFTEGLLLNRSIEEERFAPHVGLQDGTFVEGQFLRAEASRKTTQIRTKMASIDSPVKDLRAAATSRKSSSPAGWKTGIGYCCWMNPTRASTSAPRKTSTTRYGPWLQKGAALWLSAPSSPNL